MNQQLRSHAEQIIRRAIDAVMPDAAVRKALTGMQFPGRVVLVAVGKAAWQMAKTAFECLEGRVDRGIVITKYGHVMGPIGSLTCLEAGHPVPDENSVNATRQALEMVKGLTEQDTVVFLLSGGGSALFEDPLIPMEQLQDITRQLLACGADITEINTIRKRLSGVKGGRFGLACAPATVYTVALSDVVRGGPDMIASGPACADPSTCQQALQIMKRYGLHLSDRAMELLAMETPKDLPNARMDISGSVRELVDAAAQACRELGYTTKVMAYDLAFEAQMVGHQFGILVSQHRPATPMAFVAGGETVVKLTGTGKGGRNQEVALAAIRNIAGRNACVFSVGSDGTDGPTDAAGGYVDGDTFKALILQGINFNKVLEDNDSYHALERCDGLIFTGPTGTNVNDVTVALIAADSTGIHHG